MGYAEKLQRLCAMRGLDQTTLADRVGLSRSSMSRVLSGAQEPKLRLAYDLARALGVTLDYLADDDQEVESPGQFVVVSEDELAILKMVRRLGVEAAFDRLLGVGGQGAGPGPREGLEAESGRPYPPQSPGPSG